MGASRIFDDGNAEYLARSDGLITAFPITIAGWFNTDATAAQTVYSEGRSSSNNGLLTLRTLAGGNVNYAIQDDAASVTVSFSTTTSYSNNVWHHAAAYSTNSADHVVFLDGGGRNTDTTAVAFPTANRSAVAALIRSGSAQLMSGNVAHVAIWNIALSDAEIGDLASGILPSQIQPQAIVGYWPIWGLDSPEADYSTSGNTMPLNSTPSESGSGPPAFVPKVT